MWFHSHKSSWKSTPGIKFILGLTAIFLLVTLLEAGHHHDSTQTLTDDCALCAHNLSVEKSVVELSWTAPVFAVQTSEFLLASITLGRIFYGHFSIRAPPVAH